MFRIAQERPRRVEGTPLQDCWHVNVQDWQVNTLIHSLLF
jgi:hypothetical protein